MAQPINTLKMYAHVKPVVMPEITRDQFGQAHINIAGYDHFLYESRGTVMLDPKNITGTAEIGSIVVSMGVEFTLVELRPYCGAEGSVPEVDPPVGCETNGENECRCRFYDHCLKTNWED